MKTRSMTLVAVTVLLFTINPLRGQFELGDGRGLEKDLSQGTGGDDNPEVGFNVRRRNALVTGNITGLGYFHDDVDYGAPGEFFSSERESEGTTDDLFRFRAQSSSTGYAAISASQFNLVRPETNVAASTIVYRPNTGLSISDLLQGNDERLLYQFSQQGKPGIRSFGQSAGPFEGIDEPGVQDFRLPKLPRGGSLGLVGRSGREVFGIQASPLRGVYLSPLQGEEGLHFIPAEGQEGALVSSATIAQAYPSDLGNTALGQVPGAFSPAIEIGLHLQGLVPGQQEEGFTATDVADRRIGQIQQELFRPLSSTATEPGQDVYLDLLAQIREQHRIALGLPKEPEAQSTPAKASPIESWTQAMAVNPALAGTDQPLGVNPPSRGLDQSKTAIWPRSLDQMEEARLERIDALQTALGLKAQSGQSYTGTGAKQGGPRHALTNLLEMLDYEMPGLRTLASDKQTLAEQMMRDAETSLGEQRYIDAQTRYRRVLIVDPDHVTGRIGLVHAQLGAGLIRSAAFNLRRLFEDHPEMIAARYGPEVMPTPERLKRTLAQLGKMIEMAARVDAALMVAYLGYQTKAQQHVVAGLDLAQKQRPKDALIPLLRRIWVDGSTDQPKGRSDHEPHK